MSFDSYLAGLKRAVKKVSQVDREFREDPQPDFVDSVDDETRKTAARILQKRKQRLKEEAEEQLEESQDLYRVAVQ